MIHKPARWQSKQDVQMLERETVLFRRRAILAACLDAIRRRGQMLY